MRILNAEPSDYSEKATRILRSLGDLTQKEVAQDGLIQALAGHEVVLVRLGLRLTSDILEQADVLRVIVTPTTGIDHIDVEAAGRKGIAVLSLRDEESFLETISSTAEHALGLMLALLRRTAWAFDDVRGGAWDRNSFIGRDLAGSNLGVIGLGRLGRKVASIAAELGATVGAFDRSWERVPEDVHRFDALEDLLDWSHIISLHVPLTEDTRHLIDEAALSRLSNGAFIVNTSRGDVIDEDALIRALEEERIGGAALDVLANEPPAGVPLASKLVEYARTHDNLLITPHLGGASWDSMRRAELFMAEKLRAHITGATGKLS